jgi:hypothetical protein
MESYLYKERYLTGLNNQQKLKQLLNDIKVVYPGVLIIKLKIENKSYLYF